MSKFEYDFRCFEVIRASERKAQDTGRVVPAG